MTTTTPTRPRRAPRPGYSVMGRRLDPVTGKVAIPDLRTVYVAYWHELQVLKVGQAWKDSRLLQLEQAGAEIVLFIDKVPESFEAGAQAVMHEWAERAYRSKAEADAAGLPDGTGYTECYEVPAAALDFYLDLIIHEGFERYAYGPSPAALARRADQRGDARPADVGTAAVGAVELAAAGPGTVAAEPEESEGERVPVRCGGHGRQPDARRARARGSRPPRDQYRPRRARALPDPGARPGRAVCPAEPAGGSRRARLGVPLSACSQRTHSDGRKREGGRECGGGRAAPASPLSTEADTARALLRRSSAPRPRSRTLRPLRASTPVRKDLDRVREERPDATRRPQQPARRHLRRPGTVSAEYIDERIHPRFSSSSSLRCVGSVRRSRFAGVPSRWFALLTFPDLNGAPDVA